jgi:DNA (cytosine-5)-methyltransferase 1
MIPPGGEPDTALFVTLQPRVARRGIEWLNRVMLANRRDTWGEAAEIVLAAIAGDPLDPVNGWTFTAADVPARPRFIGGWNSRAGHPIRFLADASICVRLPAPTARHFVRLTGLGLTASRAAGAALLVACRLDPAAARYLPGGAAVTAPLALYNEHDPEAAAWLRELIARGLIANGIVDERSIEDIEPGELAGFVQCPFFAGIGVWSYALRLAGWPDDRPVWTGSCPCQPFSTAGKGRGVADERHLWPAWFHLVDARRPGVVFGEQVASRDGLAWLDLVSADLEGAGYAFGAADLCAAGFGAPHIRQRLYFAGVAGWRGPRRLGYALGARLEGYVGHGDGAAGWSVEARSAAAASLSRGLADAERRAAERHGFALDRAAGDRQGAGAERQRLRDDARHGGAAGGLADADREGLGFDPQRDGDALAGREAGESRPDPARRGDDGGPGGGRPGATNGRWRDADWLLCRDPDGPRWRPVESGSFPLADRPAARVVRLRGYGNAIVSEVGAGWLWAAVVALGLAPLGGPLA